MSAKRRSPEHMKLRALQEAMANDAMALSDEEIFSEVLKEGLDPVAVAASLREGASALILEARRRKLIDARIRLDAVKVPKASPKRVIRPPLETIKQRIIALMDNEAGDDALSLAFRNGQQQSESDWESLWDDLVDLGLAKSDDSED